MLCEVSPVLAAGFAKLRTLAVGHFSHLVFSMGCDILPLPSRKVYAVPTLRNFGNDFWSHVRADIVF